MLKRKYTIMNTMQLVIVLLVFTTAWSCKKGFLETTPSQDITRQGYVTSLNACNEFLNGIYIDLTEIYRAEAMVYADITADNIKPLTATSTAAFYNHYTWNQQANELSSNAVSMNGYWYSCYKVIRGCNFIIEKVDEFKNDNLQKANHIKGQALALRALAHHELVRVFAQPWGFTANAGHIGIPYVKDHDWTKPIKRETLNANYEHIIEDLKNAVQLISPDVNVKVFMTTKSVKALLARVYLYKRDYNAAKNYAREVGILVPIITNTTANPAKYPNTLFTQNDSEALFQLAPAYSSMGYTTLFVSFYFRKSISFVATDNITNLLAESSKDLRKVWVTNNSGVKNITKFPSGVMAGAFSDPSMSYYHDILRSSEMYLIAAEAYANLGNADSARFYLDAIRLRADATLPATVSSGTELLESIYREQRKELCFENFRMFDLLRTEKGVNRTDTDVDAAFRQLPYPSKKAVAPINLTDISYYGILQNDGY